jgi:uncharacterized membrane protein YeaQ/YmgE (transglycosylase-associated protein family)
MIDLPIPRHAPAVWLIFGLLLGIITSLITGEGMLEEIPLGTAGGLVGGTLSALVGERRNGVRFHVLDALVGALVLITVFDILKAL